MNTPLVLLAVAVFVLLVLARTITIAPQTRGRDRAVRATRTRSPTWLIR
jgi:hypothetical protein